MKAKTVWRSIGGVLLFIGVLTFLKIADEIYTGVLSGSRTYGVTSTNSPVGFYINIVLEGVIAAALCIFGVSCLRFKEKPKEEGVAKKEVDQR